jgi:peptide subunit release factor 1 (eRF1)
MSEQQSRRVQVEIYLSPENQVTLSRYMGEINAMISRDNELLRELNICLVTDLWTEQDTIAALFGAALERERKMQTIKDGISDEPPWITQLVRETIKELKQVGS